MDSVSFLQSKATLRRTVLSISKVNANFRFKLKLQTKEETQHHFGLIDPMLRGMG